MSHANNYFKHVSIREEKPENILHADNYFKHTSIRAWIGLTSPVITELKHQLFLSEASGTGVPWPSFRGLCLPLSPGHTVNPT